MIPVAIMMISDEEDRAFIRRLFLENELAMFIAAYRVVGDYHIACDMVSESCVTMIEKIKYLREIDICKQTSYIISIVRNRSLMYLRKRRREMSLLTGSEYIHEDKINRTQEEVDSKLIAEAEMQIIHEALSRIHKRDSQLLKMKYFEKISDEEIAEIMGISAASVRFYLTKARRNFAEEFKKRRVE